MLAVAAAAGILALVAGFVYLRHERQGWHGVGLAGLRLIGLTALLLVFVNPVRTARVSGGAPTVLLDASLSMGVAGGRWEEAVDSARSLAQDGGVILRFGSQIGPFDGSPPHVGVTLLREALASARARGGATVVITDGEVEDAGSVPPALTPGTQFVVLPRDTVPNTALLSLDAPDRVQRTDSLTVTLTIGTWGPLDHDTAEIVILVGDRRLARADIALPPSPGNARRRLTIPAGLLAAGAHVLRVRLDVDGDGEPRDNERYVLVEVSEQPAIVVIVDPPDWEGRFLVAELSDIARTPVRGYARTAPATWLDMRSLVRVSDGEVRRAARTARLLVLRGRPGTFTTGRRGPAWLWPVADPRFELLVGDWYLTRELPVSPLAGRLAGLEWDSLAPLSGMLPVTRGDSEWLALAARQGRRGAERPVLLGRDSGGIRRLTTAGDGLWRWRFRGGAAREAYRAVLAAGIDWLLAEQPLAGSVSLTSSAVVQRGMPVVFRWSATGPVPDSLEVTLASDTTSVTRMIRFRPDGTASLSLDPGIYRWVAPDASNARGVAVVEPYSDEFPPRAIVDAPSGSGKAFTLVERHAREQWWLFVVAILAFAGEWAWRQRRGLP